MVPAAFTIVILVLTSLQNKEIDANARNRGQKEGVTLRTDTNFEKEGNHHLKGAQDKILKKATMNVKKARTKVSRNLL